MYQVILDVSPSDTRCITRLMQGLDQGARLGLSKSVQRSNLRALTHYRYPRPAHRDRARRRAPGRTRMQWLLHSAPLRVHSLAEVGAQLLVTAGANPQRLRVSTPVGRPQSCGHQLCMEGAKTTPAPHFASIFCAAADTSCIVRKLHYWVGNGCAETANFSE